MKLRSSRKHWISSLPLAIYHVLKSSCNWGYLEQNMTIIYCLISTLLVACYLLKCTSLYTYNLINRIICRTRVLAFHFSCLAMDVIHKEMLSSAFYCSKPSPLPCGLKLFHLDLPNSINFRVSISATCRISTLLFYSQFNI